MLCVRVCWFVCDCVFRLCLMVWWYLVCYCCWCCLCVLLLLNVSLCLLMLDCVVMCVVCVFVCLNLGLCVVL